MPGSVVNQGVLANGLSLVAERIEGVRSVAFNLMVPAGSSTDPEESSGSASVLSEMAFRGAGSRNSRQIVEYLDGLGVRRGTSVIASHTIFSGALVGSKLKDVLAPYADIAQRALLPDSEFEPSRELILQELASLEDDPISKVLQELQFIHYPYPLGRPAVGTKEGLQALTRSCVAQDYASRYGAGEAILAVAGDFRWEDLRDAVEELFGGWARGTVPAPALRPRSRKSRHLPQDTAQVQIGVAFDSVTYSHPKFYAARAVVGVLSGGMSSRLFVEVREKRGLAYAVAARYHSLKEIGTILCYAGTTPDRAQQTLDVLLSELKRVCEGITDEELDRTKAGLLSSLVMDGESSLARASSIAADWYMLGRVVPLTQVKEDITRLRPRDLLDYLQEYPPRDFTFVTLGPKELVLPVSEG